MIKKGDPVEMRKKYDVTLHTTRILHELGYWTCCECSTERLLFNHRTDETTCPATGKSKEECEIILY